MLSIVQLSKFFVLSFATALIYYHIFRRLSTTFLFLLFQRCVLARNSLSRISCSSTFVNNFFSFHIFRIFGCASWTAVLLSPVSRESLYNIAQQSHHCQQLFHLFIFIFVYIYSFVYITLRVYDIQSLFPSLIPYMASDQNIPVNILPTLSIYHARLIL